ncbi:M48 family metallopeptidase [Aureimonas mangrovi]|uniref:M48 family metallopeptidase n=1 Tax=Aureimonas mangrovi TaxID=2758041 RepID=UPI00163DD11F|nr:SprT family zinc-dependent metalloprotease [Aureimonas mangrovi]
MTGPVSALLRIVGRRPAFPESVEIGGRTMALAVREHATARRIVMRLSPCGGIVRLTVPKRTSARRVAEFIERYSGWVEARMAAVPGRIEVADGRRLPFRGGELELRHEPGRRQARLLPATPEGPAVLLLGGEPTHLRRRVRDMLVREARRDLEEAVERHARAANVKPAGLSVKDTTSRWGSCSSARRLSFSFRLVMAPPFVLDYLAAHEVAHLKEMNHGPRFWALCESLYPRSDEARAWLKANGTALHAVDFG